MLWRFSDAATATLAEIETGIACAIRIEAVKKLRRWLLTVEHVMLLGHRQGR